MKNLLAGTVAAIAALVLASSAAAAGTVWSWGSNGLGQLGHANAKVRCSGIECAPSPVPVLAGASAISAGTNHSLAIWNGSVVSWGANTFGQLGYASTNTCVSVPCNLRPRRLRLDAVAVAAGFDFSLALLPNGTVDAWGLNDLGQLGVPTPTSRTAPMPVPGLTNVKAIAAGGSHALALLNDGTVMAWGEDESGELGNGTLGPDTCSETYPCSTSPVPVGSPGNGPLRNVQQIAAGNGFSMALAGSSVLQVDTWGNNSMGQLGQGTTSGPDTCSGYPCSPVPIAVSGLNNLVTSIAANAGANQALAISIYNGGVIAWGDNSFGQSGSACGYTCPTPTVVPGVSNATQIATSGDGDYGGSARSMALTSSGSVLEWGSPLLGNGTSGNSSTPVSLGSLSGPSAIAAGADHSLAIAAPPPDKFSLTLAQCKCSLATLKVHVPDPGVINAFQLPMPHNLSTGSEPAVASAAKKRLVKTVTVNVSSAGTVKLKLHLTPAGKRKLRHKHKLKVKVTIFFTPTGGVTASQTVTVTFKR